MKDTFIPLLEKIGIDTDSANIIHWLCVILCIVLLFYVSSFICQKIIIPLSRRITRKTQFKWDEIIFNVAKEYLQPHCRHYTACSTANARNGKDSIV